MASSPCGSCGTEEFLISAIISLRHLRVEARIFGGHAVKLWVTIVINFFPLLWDRMAAPRTVSSKVVKFGTRPQDSLIIIFTKLCATTLSTLAPPLKSPILAGKLPYFTPLSPL